MLFNLANSQEKSSYKEAAATANVEGEGSEDDDGLGTAEIIAIVVCGLIICAFLLACCVMVRNASKRRSMKEGGAASEMSFDQIKNDSSFATTKQIRH